MQKMPVSFDRLQVTFSSFASAWIFISSRILANWCMWFCLPNFVKIRWSPTALWRHVDITRWGHTCSFANLLPVSGHVWHLRKPNAIGVPNFDQISQFHGRDITTSGYRKRTAPILKFYFRLQLWFFTVTSMWFCIGLSNFMQILCLFMLMELWRHIDF